MLSIRHHPELVTPALLAWLRAFVKYDDDGRGSIWLADGGRPLPVALAIVAEKVVPGRTWSGVLLQSYRDGRAITPCHTDKGGTGFSFILSLGAARTLRLHRGSCEAPTDVVAVECVNGLVLLMDQAFQEQWHHQIIADKCVNEEKLSLVFRTPLGG